MREILAATQFSNLKPNTSHLSRHERDKLQFVSLPQTPQKSVKNLFVSFFVILPRPRGFVNSAICALRAARFADRALRFENHWQNRNTTGPSGGLPAAPLNLPTLEKRR